MSTNLKPSRECIREACENCREKKAKCDGETPCHRCIARRLECGYEPRRIRSKRSLQAELNTLKAAQRQKDSVIAALSVPGQSMDVLQRLWAGEPLETIYDTLGCGEVLCSPEASSFPANGIQGPTAPSQPATSAFSASSSSAPTDTQAWSTPQSAIEQIKNAMGEDPGTAHRGKEMECDVHAALERSKGHAVGSMLSHSDLANLTYNGPLNHFGFGTPNCQPTIPSDAFAYTQQCDANLQHFENASSPYDSENLSKSSSSIQMSQISFTNGSSIESLLWPSSEDVFPLSTDLSNAHPAPSPVTSPIMISSTECQPGFHEVIDEYPAKSPFWSPPKQQTPNGESPFRSWARTEKSNVVARFSTSPSVTEDNTQTSGEHSTYASDLPQTRKRPRIASASSHKKQKDQIEFMRAVKSDVEIRNKKLKKERTELWHQMIVAKSALIGHADCNHPSINAYLQAEAANFVRGSLNSHSRKAEG